MDWEEACPPWLALLAMLAGFAVAWWSFSLPGMLGLVVLGCSPVAAADSIGLAYFPMLWLEARCARREQQE